jgi:hypothetical protein
MRPGFLHAPAGEVLATGRRLADALIPDCDLPVGAARKGSLAEMSLGGGNAVVVGFLGYVGLVLDEGGARVPYLLGLGSPDCDAAFAAEYMGRRPAAGGWLARLGGGLGGLDGSAEAVSMLVSLEVPDAVDDMLSGVSRPWAGLVALGGSPAEWLPGRRPGQVAVPHDYGAPLAPGPALAP